jgi:hypothetical protein
MTEFAAAQETNWFFWHTEFVALGEQAVYINDDTGAGTCTVSFFTEDSTDINSSGTCSIDSGTSVDLFLANG